MHKWAEVASAIYYSGVGAVLLATSIRFLYTFIRNIEKKSDMINEVPEIKRRIRKLYRHLKLDDDQA
jgi:hypothetical protein